MAYDANTAERVRRLLARRDDLAEKRMVGGLSFLVDGRMCCGVSGAGLVVRLPPEEVRVATTQPHVAPMTMGGRPLRAFVLVSPPGYADDAALQAWLDRGLEAVARLP